MRCVLIKNGKNLKLKLKKYSVLNNVENRNKLAEKLNFLS
jgi:hypothetical protein